MACYYVCMHDTRIHIVIILSFALNILNVLFITSMYLISKSVWYLNSLDLVILTINYVRKMNQNKLVCIRTYLCKS